MNTFTATFRIVTPMFLGGADPFHEAEIRTPSIKGALRFWWRAFMWGRVGTTKELHQREAELFGSNDEGQSLFLMRLEATFTEANIVQENWSPASWQRYTGYGLRDKDVNGVKQNRRFLNAGREFTVHFRLRRCGEEQKSQIIAATQLFGLLGGLGSRSRKGWGSVTLTEMGETAWECPATADSWKKIIHYLTGGSASATAPYTAFTASSLWNCGPAKRDGGIAQQWLAQRYQFRVKSTNPKAARAQFGLPRAFKRGTRQRMERRASPLLLHIHQCPGGQALPTALWMPADFLPGEEETPGGGTSAREFVESLSSDQ